MHDSEVQAGNSCAGMNRHAAKDESDLQEKSGDPLGPEFCAGHRHHAVLALGRFVQNLDVRDKCVPTS